MAERDDPRGRPGPRRAGAGPRPSNASGRPARPAGDRAKGDDDTSRGRPSSERRARAERPRGESGRDAPRERRDGRPASARSSAPRSTDGSPARSGGASGPRLGTSGDRPGRPSRSRDDGDRRGDRRGDQQRERGDGGQERTRTPHAGPRGRRAPNPDWTDAPEIPEGLDPSELDPDLRHEVASLSAAVSERVAGHLLAAIESVDADPELALRHARAARAQGGRLGRVREAVGVIAYEAGDWALALADLRTGRRITGHRDLIALEADCERALGRPEKALALATGPVAGALDRSAAVELAIVASGARRDLGQARAAALALEGIGATDSRLQPWSARLRYAYAAALLDAGRREDAVRWFDAAAAADVDELTNAAERADELRG